MGIKCTMRVNVCMVTIVAAAVLGGCESGEERARRAAVDSMAEAKARGETDLNNPEMGSKVLVTLTADSISQSHTTIPPGQVTFAIQNHDSTAHVFQMTGTSGNWRTMEIPPQGTVLLSMIIEAGAYDMFCPDTAGGRNVCGAPRKISTQ